MSRLETKMSFGGHGLNMKQALLPLPTVVTKISFGGLGLNKKQAPTVVKPIKVTTILKF